MGFRIRLAVAFSVFVLVNTAAAQASSAAQDDDLSSLRQQADAGDAKAQFAES